MTAADQLARIAASRPPQVRIYLLDRGYSVWGWLCGKHLAIRLGQGWELKDEKDPPHELTCDLRWMGTCGAELQP
jgi:hypothetical protein